MELKSCNVGDTVYLPHSLEDYGEVIDREVCMIIDAPRGRLVLFKFENENEFGTSYIKHTEAIKAFMDRHSTHDKRST